MNEDQYRKLLKSYQPGGTAREKKIKTVFDNDGGYFTCVDSLLNDEQSGEVVRAFEAEMNFSGPDGYQDIVDLANAAGIDAEWC